MLLVMMLGLLFLAASVRDIVVDPARTGVVPPPPEHPVKCTHRRVPATGSKAKSSWQE